MESLQSTKPFQHSHHHKGILPIPPPDRPPSSLESLTLDRLVNVSRHSYRSPDLNSAPPMTGLSTGKGRIIFTNRGTVFSPCSLMESQFVCSYPTCSLEWFAWTEYGQPPNLESSGVLKTFINLGRVYTVFRAPAPARRSDSTPYPNGAPVRWKLSSLDRSAKVSLTPLHPPVKILSSAHPLTPIWLRLVYHCRRGRGRTVHSRPERPGTTAGRGYGRYTARLGRYLSEHPLANDSIRAHPRDPRALTLSFTG